MRAFFSVLFCGFLFSTSSFSVSCKIQNYIKKFVNDVNRLDNDVILETYFSDLENRAYTNLSNEEVVKLYSEAFIEIRTKINPKKKIAIQEIEDRVYKVSQKDFFFYLKLKEKIDSIESVVAITKGERIIGWL